MSELALSAEAAEQRYLRIAALAGLAVTLARLLWLAVGTTDLYPDEAQYWLWSRTPDWGYFSKPPLVAWVIAGTTALVGDGSFGVRAAAPLFHLGTSLLVYAIARRLYEPRTACWSSVTFLTLPGISVSSLLISTDVPLLFFWAASLYAFLRARDEEGWRWWLMLGVALGLGLLSKYAMAYWLLCAALFLAAERRERRHLPRLLAAAALGLAIYAPNFAWNAAHSFVSYEHTGANANLGRSLFHPLELAEFVLSQAGVFGPLLFGALVALVATRALRGAPERILAWFSLPVLGIVTALSLLSRSNANWAAPAYVALTILVVAWLLRLGRMRLVSASLALHVALAALLMGGREAAAAVGIGVPARLDPWLRLRGWSELGDAVGRLAAAHPGFVIASDDRELLAALAYYVRPGPPRLAKWNADRVVGDHFDLTADMAPLVGADFLFVTAAEDARGFAPYFASTAPLATFTTPRRHYTIWAFRGFRGYGPAS
jgi:4-amino-4-deoxy-L-arabinose transferase-like glycosyltransferase